MWISLNLVILLKKIERKRKEAREIDSSNIFWARHSGAHSFLCFAKSSTSRSWAFCVSIWSLFCELGGDQLVFLPIRSWLSGFCPWGHSGDDSHITFQVSIGDLNGVYQCVVWPSRAHTIWNAVACGWSSCSLLSHLSGLCRLCHAMTSGRSILSLLLLWKDELAVHIFIPRIYHRYAQALRPSQTFSWALHEDAHVCMCAHGTFTQWNTTGCSPVFTEGVKGSPRLLWRGHTKAEEGWEQGDRVHVQGASSHQPSLRRHLCKMTR